MTSGAVYLGDIAPTFNVSAFPFHASVKLVNCLTRSSPAPSPKSTPSMFKNNPLMEPIMKRPSLLEVGDNPEANARARIWVMIGSVHHW